MSPKEKQPTKEKEIEGLPLGDGTELDDDEEELDGELDGELGDKEDEDWVAGEDDDELGDLDEEDDPLEGDPLGGEEETPWKIADGE